VKLHHGALVVDLPNGWSDRSTLLFVAPPETQNLPTTAHVQEPTEAIAVHFSHTSAQSAQQVLHEQSEQLRQVDPNYRLVSEGPFSCGLGEGWRYTQELKVGEQYVSQLSVACLLKTLAIVATASAPSARFARNQAQLLTILESLALQPKESAACD